MPTVNSIRSRPRAMKSCPHPSYGAEGLIGPAIWPPDGSEKEYCLGLYLCGDQEVSIRSDFSRSEVRECAGPPSSCYPGMK
jgi:hypothetical protein